ncbi:urea transporter [Arthrobacter roseus]|uniref:urea transporter n=1 Tax=Arthrobacter roseus TaxID=136274 RepID=UPI0019639A57|nr:urea transporter [Arthrobacter roseus]MBM7849427.1 urea transporter [Arthrobacter roseus]
MTPTLRSALRPAYWARVLVEQLGDVVLFPRVAAGLLVAVAIALDDPVMLLPVLVGTVAATASSVWMKRVRKAASAAGMFGYCGALVGAASYLTFDSGATASAVAAVGGLVCGPVAAAVAASVRAGALSKVELPVLTAPFCLISGAVALLASRGVKQPTASVQAESGPSLEPLMAAGQSVLTNISQVLLVNNALSGALLLAGLLVIHWRLGLTALAGSVVAGLVGWAAVGLGFFGHDDGTALQDGLLGYSAVLTAVAVAVIFERPTRRCVVVALLAAALTVPLAILLSATPIPVFTWPYIVGTWMALTYLRS